MAEAGFDRCEMVLVTWEGMRDRPEGLWSYSENDTRVVESVLIIAFGLTFAEKYVYRAWR